MNADRTTLLLLRWNEGDQAALQELLTTHLDWIRAMVQRELGARLRQKLESGDVVQDALIEFLRYGPRIKPRDGAQFRAIIKRIVINALRDCSGWFGAKRRDMAREQPVSAQSTVDLSLPAVSPPPDERAATAELEERIRLVIEIMQPEDRRVLILRDWDGMSFPDIAAEIESTADAARMRYERALVRLRTGLEAIRRGAIENVLDAG